ncbi:MAG TPA: GGDEF domain-containing protein [Planctomycetota bacterium]|nr:GGDEF domain-containing protein [Planctomycetota bacterium]
MNMSSSPIPFRSIIAHGDSQLLKTLIDNIPDFIYAKDAQGRYVIDNAADQQILGVNSPEEVIGRTVFDFFPPEIAERFHADDLEVISTGKPLFNREEPYRDKDGNLRWLSTTKVPLRDPKGIVTGLVGISRDITDQKLAKEELARANEQLRRLVREDSLTCLLNRRTVMDVAAQEWARWQRYGRELSILIIDADDFKAVNDSYGHLAGDQALKFVADTLSQSMRVTDSVGRYGGEEFLAVLPDTSLDGALHAGDKIVKAVREASISLANTALKLTVSIGAATAHRNDAGIDSLVHRADQALYLAKQRGKNRIEAAAV